MSAPVILSILLVVSYVGATIWKERKFPDSISSMVWALPEGAWRWLWSVWLVIVSVLTFAPIIGVLDTVGLGIFGFLPMVCFGFVAAWPLFDQDHAKLHNIVAVIGGVFSQVAVLLICPELLALWLLMLLALLKPLRCKSVMISECICYVAIIGVLI